MANAYNIIVFAILIFCSLIYFFARDRSDVATKPLPVVRHNPVMPTSPELAVGQAFIVGIGSAKLDEDTKNFLKKIRPGGIVLYEKNIVSDDQLTSLISDLQALATSTTRRKYFIMIDEEPGGASRLGLFKDIFSSGIPDWLLTDRDIQRMKKIGINVDLAPLADFPFDSDSFIASRIPVRSVEQLIYFNGGFVQRLQNDGIGATLKHFPGLGIVTHDPHRGISYSEASSTLIDLSISIFKKGIDDGASFVMTGHGIYGPLDPGVPATMSKKIVGRLRDELGFKGIIITDDLSDMPFILNKTTSIGEATLGSIEAGNTMVLFSRKKDKALESWSYLVKKYEEDSTLRRVIDSNYDHIATYKESHSLK